MKPEKDRGFPEPARRITEVTEGHGEGHQLGRREKRESLRMEERKKDPKRMDAAGKYTRLPQQRGKSAYWRWSLAQTHEQGMLTNSKEKGDRLEGPHKQDIAENGMPI